MRARAARANYLPILILFGLIHTEEEEVEGLFARALASWLKGDCRGMESFHDCTVNNPKSDFSLFVVSR